MENFQKKALKDERLSFAKESGIVPKESNKKFKLLIVDDENEIHVMTKLVLDDYSFMDQGLEFLSAFSGAEAKKIIQANSDIACCLLDVVMETKDAGLEVARFIREDENNSKTRIVLRTGQPGKAPEKDIILNYDINDYKEKTELTTQKLFTTMTTALRSYVHLVELENKNQEIQSKNIRLNEEIARRIVAESNLTKYNRSLGRMIESKTQRLKQALATLEETQKELFITQKAAIVSDLSVVSLQTLDDSNIVIDSNLKKMNIYRQQMTFLLEKYNTLEEIIALHQGNKQEMEEAASKNICKIKAFKSEIDLNTVLEKYPKIIEDSIKGISQISQVINDIKMFVAINDEHLQSTDINHLLKQICDIESWEDKTINIQLDLQELPLVNLAKKNFKMAVQAILDNAVRATIPHGIISVSSRYENPNILLTISDIGIGISQEILPQIFTPYFSSWDTNAKGLGLSFAKSILLNCSADIKVTSTPKQGTTVIICLPATPSDLP